MKILLRILVEILTAELLWKNNVIGTKLAIQTLTFISLDNKEERQFKTRSMTGHAHQKEILTD